MSMNDISQLMLEKFLSRGHKGDLDQIYKISRLVPQVANIMAGIATDIIFSPSLQSTALANNISKADVISKDHGDGLIKDLFAQNTDKHDRNRVVEGIFMARHDHDLRPILYKTEGPFKNNFFDHVTANVLADDKIVYGRDDTFNIDYVLYHTENPPGFLIMNYQPSETTWLREKAADNLRQKHVLNFSFAERETFSAHILQERAKENAKKLQMMIYTSPHQIILSGPTVEKNIVRFTENGMDVSTEKMPKDATEYFPEMYSNIPGQPYFTID